MDQKNQKQFPAHYQTLRSPTDAARKHCTNTCINLMQFYNFLAQSPFLPL